MSVHNKLYPWRLAQIRHAMVAWITLPFKISELFWTAWSAAMYPEGAKA